MSDLSAAIPTHANSEGVARGRIGSTYGPYSSSQAHLLNNSNMSINSYSPSLRSPSLCGSDAGFADYMDAGDRGSVIATKEESQLEWDFNDDKDDALHAPDPKGSDKGTWRLWTLRGWANAAALFFIVAALLGVFAVWPLASFYIRAAKKESGWGLGGINGTGQGQSGFLLYGKHTDLL